MFECDMHTHTVRSDGHLTPKESIDRAVELGLKVLVISDHDTTLPLMYEIDANEHEILEVPEGDAAAESAEIDAIGIDAIADEMRVKREINLEDYAASIGLELVRGTEISCDTENEDVHLVGIFCDWDAPEFLELEKEIRRSRMNGYRRMVENLAAAGYDVSWEEVLQYAGRVDDPENVYKKQIYEYIAVKGFASDWKDGKKLVKSRPEFDPGREKPDPVDIIHLIHKTGGKVIMAHPFLVKDEVYYKGKKMTRFEYIDMLIEAGLDGIEACYPYEKTSYTGNLSSGEIERMVRDRYGNLEESGVFLSGGSDFHGDFVTGMKNPRELGECGISYEYYCEYVRKVEKWNLFNGEKCEK